MAKKQNKFEKQDEQLQEVNNALSGAGQWIINHSKMLTWCLTILVVAIMGIMLYRQHKQGVENAQHAEVVNANGRASLYFTQAFMFENQGDVENAVKYYEIALNGDEETEGFAAIADRYDFQEAKMAAFYAGLINHRLGKKEEAIEYLQKFSSSDAHYNALAKQLLGDVYVELGQFEDAANAFEAAAATGSKLYAPMSLDKVGKLYLQELNDKERAHAAFKAIKEHYPTSLQAVEVDKYIEYTK